MILLEHSPSRILKSNCSPAMAQCHEVGNTGTVEKTGSQRELPSLEHLHKALG
ncbi:hypothetical protein AMATHDRAFT_10073 [Amanita thiersii Skay4041]|uniref:Uncharacterized protein n=1 Tax=Amanita thiersii Skay4041 TaxID=703135 RepID=A0A2A9NA03_9AGAR|nr:hypothetical protein AMATHDRAFT_10073 [Amanita thiersii Skay4041]